MGELEMIKKFKVFEQFDDPFGEEQPNEKHIFEIVDKEVGVLGYVIARSDNEAIDMAFEKDWICRDDHRNYFFANDVMNMGLEYTLTTATENFEKAKFVLDTLNDCMEKMK